MLPPLPGEPSNPFRPSEPAIPLDPFGVPIPPEPPAPPRLPFLSAPPGPAAGAAVKIRDEVVIIRDGYFEVGFQVRMARHSDAHVRRLAVAQSGIVRQ